MEIILFVIKKMIFINILVMESKKTGNNWISKSYQFDKFDSQPKFIFIFILVILVNYLNENLIYLSVLISL